MVVTGQFEFGHTHLDSDTEQSVPVSQWHQLSEGRVRETPWIDMLASMSDPLLVSIRDGIIAGRSLPDLLRACIFLGSDTGSDALQTWARCELEGYPEKAQIPDYRVLEHPPVFATMQTGYQVRHNVVVAPWNVPERAREYFPSTIRFTQPIRTISQYASADTPTFLPGKLLALRDIFNQEYAPFQQIAGISVKLDSSYFAGLVDQVRTKLTSMVADMTSNNPLHGLPSAETVDRVVRQNIENYYNTTVEKPTGPTAVGTGATANQSGMTVDEVITLIDRLNVADYDLPEEDQSEVEAVAGELRAELQSGKPDRTVVTEKKNRLQQIADKVGIPTFTAAIGGIAQSLTTMGTTGLLPG